MDAITTLTAVKHLAMEYLQLKYGEDILIEEKWVNAALSKNGFSDISDLLISLHAKAELEQCATSGDKKRLSAIKAFAKKVVKENPSFKMEGVIQDKITGQDMLMTQYMVVRFNEPLPPSIPRPPVDGGTYDIGRLIPNENSWEGKVNVVALEQMLKERKALVKAGTLPKDFMNKVIFGFSKSDIVIMVNLECLVLAARCIEDDNRKVEMSITGGCRPIILNTDNGTAAVLPIRLVETDKPITPDYIIDGE